MLKIISTDSERTIGFTITGHIKSEDLDLATTAIAQKLATHDNQAHPKLRVYAKIDRLQGISFLALLKDLQFTLKHWQDFEKEAIVTDSKWWPRLTLIANKIVPGIEVKYFPLKEKDAAWRWVHT